MNASLGARKMVCFNEGGKADRTAGFDRVLLDLQLKAFAESQRPGLARRLTGRLLDTARARKR
jgi:hypothetical protein